MFFFLPGVCLVLAEVLQFHLARSDEFFQNCFFFVKGFRHIDVF